MRVRSRRIVLVLCRPQFCVLLDRFVEPLGCLLHRLSAQLVHIVLREVHLLPKVYANRVRIVELDQLHRHLVMLVCFALKLVCPFRKCARLVHGVDLRT
jgi:hypothetical protein